MSIESAVHPPGAPPHRPNRLAAEPSPYLRQHADNPVDWYPWGEEAFARARAEDKPVFLSIGYSTCHWCHVMERESFADATVAAFLNAHFISIKVDREERPDVDKIYMTFVQATTGTGGWPLNVFLTPDRKPFYGGTYFPPDNRYGRASFLQVLEQVQQAWARRRAHIATLADEVRARLAQATAARRPSGLVVSADTLRRAARRFKEAYDPQHGGFGGAPKFPQPAVPAFLLRAARRFGDEEARRMVLHTCERMAAGGIYDHLGGGFARYAVDAAWRVPHFEKMLYDNAQLAALYLDAYLVSGEARWAAVARDVLHYLVRDLTHPEGGFYAAEDADSEGHEGKFYCWTEAELRQLLSPTEFAVAAAHYGITPEGNFLDHSHPNPLPGLNVLQVVRPVRDAEEAARLESAKTKMRRARAQRVRPLRDEKILTGWNGLTLGALARAAAILGEDTWLTAAQRNLQFVQTHLWQPPTGTAPGTLFHRWCAGQRDDVELLEDYALLLEGVLHLYEVTVLPEHLEFALALAEALIAKFYDAEHGGFWQSAAGRTDLILRLKDDQDGAEPSGNSAATLGLLRLAALTDRTDLRQPAETTLRVYAERLERLPETLPYLLHALDFWLDEPLRVVIAGEPRTPAIRDWTFAAQRRYQPNKIVSGHRGPVSAWARSLPATNAPRAYVCLGTACQPPVDDPARLADWLS